QAAEYFNHRSQLQAARRELAAEVEENRKGLALNRERLAGLEKELAENLALLRQKRDVPAVLGEKLSYSWNFRRPRDGAWQAARQNGALDLMPHQELQNYAHLYAVLDTSMDALSAQNAEMDRAAALAENAKNFLPTERDIDNLVAATTEAKGKAIFLGHTF